MMLRRSFVAGAAIIPALASGVANGLAQTVSSAPLLIVVPYAKGGSADIFARTIQDGLARELGRPVTVENHPGGGGALGLQVVTQSPSDGRTLLLGQTGEIVIQPYLMKLPGPRPDPVALVAVMPLAVVVPSATPYANLQDLVEKARSSPRGLSVASPGRFTPGDLAIDLFRVRTGARLAEVPFQGGGPALDAIEDGTVDLYFSTLPSAMPHLRAGKVKVLAVTSKERAKVLPDVPTIEESGVGRFTLTQWAGIFARHGVPADVIANLNRSVNAVLALPDVKSKFANDGAEVVPMSAADFSRFIEADAKLYRQFLTAELCSEIVVETCPGGGVFSR